jgi:hypothetical protein
MHVPNDVLHPAFGVRFLQPKVSIVLLAMDLLQNFRKFYI